MHNSPTGGTKWPLTGGIPSQLCAEDHQIKRLYIGGYHDGSVRIWDATYPSLNLISIFQLKVLTCLLLILRSKDGLDSAGQS